MTVAEEYDEPQPMFVHEGETPQPPILVRMWFSGGFRVGHWFRLPIYQNQDSRTLSFVIFEGLGQHYWDATGSNTIGLEFNYDSVSLRL